MSLPFLAVFGGAAFLAILTMWYVGHARQMKPGTARNAWIIAILLGNFAVFPIYWYRYIWRGREGPWRAL